MTPPIKSEARQRLAELKEALRTVEARMKERDGRTTRLQIEVDAVRDAEAALQRFDAETAEAFRLAATSDDEKALDAVKVDERKRAALLKKVAIVQSRAVGAQSAIAAIRSEEAKDAQTRNDIIKFIPVLEMVVVVEELVPTAVASATECRVGFETALRALYGVHSSLHTLAHQQPGGSEHYQPLFSRLAELGETIKRVRDDDHAEKANDAADAVLAEFVAGLKVEVADVATAA